MTTSAQPGRNNWESAAKAVPAVIDFCRGLVNHLRMELSVEASEAEGTISVNLSGADRAILLSGAASVLNCIEHLVNKVFRTGKGNSIVSIVLDSEKYRQFREAELVLLAQMASKKVVQQQRPLSLQPMCPRERRIVHLTLAGIEGVRSQSEGEGDDRSIWIYPS